MTLAFKARVICEICGNCIEWQEQFQYTHAGTCQVTGELLMTNHRCDAEVK